ncbi:MAG TPA: phage holin family protein [Xanthobacteraceae bacterium]|nr:phage holin family protein [Xanthobacteraceae bacterium]
MATRQTVSGDGEQARRNLARSDRDIVDLSQDILRDIGTLITTEFQLLRTEMSEKLALTGLAAALIATGALLLLATIVLLLQAAIAGLVAYGFSPAVATLLVAVATLLVGAALVWFGLSRLKAENLTPSKTIRQFQKDATIVGDR